MKLLIGIGTTLLIGATSYAFCPPKQVQVVTANGVNGVCTVTPMGSVNLVMPTTETTVGTVSTLTLAAPMATAMPSGAMCLAVAPCPPTPPTPSVNVTAPKRASKVMRVQGHGTTRARTADEFDRVTEARQIADEERAEIEAKLADTERAQTLEARINGKLARKTMERALRTAGESRADSRKLLTEELRVAGDRVPKQLRSMNADMKKAIEAATAHGLAIAAETAAEAANADACTAACEEACAEACEAACEAADGGADVVVINGSGTPTARTMVRGSGVAGKLTRIRYEAARGGGSGASSGTSTGDAAGDHAHILRQLEALTEEVRALREEVRALRSGDRVTETY